MSVLEPILTEVFRLTSHKALALNPSVTWVNTYEFTVGPQGVTPDAATTAALDEIAQAIVEWERQYHLSSVLFTRRVVSTWLADSEPYNGDEFLAVPTNLSGTRVATSQALSLEQCLYIQRVVAGGRTGKLYWRGCLIEEDVEAPSGTATLTSAFLASLQAALAPGGTGDLGTPIDDVSGGFLAMAGRNTADEVTLRYVTSLVPSDRVVFKKLDNRYFRRSSTLTAPLQ